MLQRAPRAGLHLAPATHDSEGGEVDIVVPVRVGEHNPHLRYALRSWAANLPHDRIWIIGHRPKWATNVRHIPTRQGSSKYRNTTAAVRTACQHPEVSDPFLLLMDDVFIMRTMRFLPVYHRGRVAELEAYYRRKWGNSAYLRGMRETRALLTKLGHPDPLSYEVHAPLPVEKAAMLHALDVGSGLQVVHKRTLYATLAGLGGERIRDPKVLTRVGGFNRDALILSTMPSSFSHGQVGQFIRSRFPLPCRYETPQANTPPGVWGTRPRATAGGRR